MLSKVVAAWNRFWFAAYDPMPLAIFRIVLGLLYAVMLVALSAFWERDYAFNGIASLDVYPGQESMFSLFHLTEPIIPVTFWWPVGIVVAISFTLGFCSRSCAIFLMLLEFAIVDRIRFFTNGEDLLFRMYFMPACFAPIGQELSIDKWLRKKRGTDFAPSIWPLRLIQVSTLAVYAVSVPMKLVSDVAWRNGEMMYWILANDLWSRWPWPQWTYTGMWIPAMTYCSLLFEGSAPFFLWFKKTRVAAVFVLVMFHMSIALLMKGISLFSLVIICGLVCFLPPEWLRKNLSKAPRVSGVAAS